MRSSTSQITRFTAVLLCIVLAGCASGSGPTTRSFSESELRQYFREVLSLQYEPHSLGYVGRRITPAALRLEMIERAAAFGGANSWARVQNPQWSQMLHSEDSRGIICVVPLGVVVVFTRNESDEIFLIAAGA